MLGPVPNILHFLSLFHKYIFNKAILSIFLKIAEKFSCIIKQILNFSTDGSGNLKNKKYHQLHFNKSSKFIILYVLAEIFEV